MSNRRIAIKHEDMIFAPKTPKKKAKQAKQARQVKQVMVCEIISINQLLIVAPAIGFLLAGYIWMALDFFGCLP